MELKPAGKQAVEGMCSLEPQRMSRWTAKNDCPQSRSCFPQGSLTTGGENLNVGSLGN